MAADRKGRAGPARAQHLRRIFLAAVGVGVVALGVASYAGGVFRSLDLSTMDARFAIRGTHRPPSDLVLVEVDDRTFNTIGYLWPFPRAVQAKVLTDVDEGDPRAVAFDVQFSDASNCPAIGSKPPPPDGNCQQATLDEEALLNAILNAKRPPIMSITTPTHYTSGPLRGTTQFDFLGSPLGGKLLAMVGGRPGDTGFPPEPGNAIRRITYTWEGYPTFAVATAEVAEHRTIKPFGGSSGVWINYAYPAGVCRPARLAAENFALPICARSPGALPVVSYSDVYDGAIKPSFFHDKVVVVGPSASSLQDFHPTPTAALMPGVEVQANAIATVLEGTPLTSVPGWINIALIIVLGLAAPLASLRLGPIATIALFAVLAVVFVVANQLAFNSGTVVSFVYPAGALVLSTGGALAVHTVTAAFERERVRDLFSRFVPEDVVDEVLATTGQGLRLGGVERFATVMFTDLRGFTSSAENMGPDNVIEVLNHYLSEMSDAILDHGGTLVAYMGDGIMAVFGAPIASEDHADRALATAREMVTVRLARFNAWMKEQGLGEGYRMGIGLNTGRVMSGNVGSERRVEYTSVGDATNTAARIEALTKGTPHQLMFSEATRDALNAVPDDAMFVEEIQIRGRRQTTKIYSVRDGTDAEVLAAAATAEGDGQVAVDGPPAAEAQPETA